MSGFNLPPGCSVGDIERAMGAGRDCLVCGKDCLEDCDCPECPACGLCGEPSCYEVGHDTEFLKNWGDLAIPEGWAGSIELKPGSFKLVRSQAQIDSFRERETRDRREQVVERWERALELLRSLTPQQRSREFNMRVWGFRRECGTTMCLAGFCSLDPWFQEQGFEGEWDSLNDALTIPGGFHNRIREFFTTELQVSTDDESTLDLRILESDGIGIFYEEDWTADMVEAAIANFIPRLRRAYGLEK